MGGLFPTSTSLFSHTHGGGEGSSLFLWHYRYRFFRKKFTGDGKMAQLSACCVCWLGFVNLSQTRVAWEDGTSVEKLPPSVWPVGMSTEHFLN